MRAFLFLLEQPGGDGFLLFFFGGPARKASFLVSYLWWSTLFLFPASSNSRAY